MLKKIGLALKRKDIDNIVTCLPNSIELLLKKLFNKVGQPIGTEELTPKERVLTTENLESSQSLANSHLPNRRETTQ